MSSSMGLGWHPIYEMDNKIHVWKHQPVIDAVYVVWLFTSWLYIHDYTLYLVYVCFLLVHLSQIPHKIGDIFWLLIAIIHEIFEPEIGRIPQQQMI